MSNKKNRPETLLDVLRAVEVRERRVVSNKKSRPETLLDVLRAVEVRERRVRRKTEIQGIPGVACGYRQGDGWIVAYWDWRARCWREYGPLGEPIGRCVRD